MDPSELTSFNNSSPSLELSIEKLNNTLSRIFLREKFAKTENTSQNIKSAIKAHYFKKSIKNSRL